MSSARKHLRNLAFNWGGHASTLLVMFFLSPYIVGKLDAVSYGIWSLLSVLTGYMGIFDLGVRASVGRHVALYLGKDDPVGVDETIRAGFGVFTLTGGLILVVGILLGWFFPALFKGVSPEHYDTVRYLLPLMVVNVWLSAIAAIYSSVLAAHDRFDVARIVDMVVLFVRTVGTIYVLEIGLDLWGLVFSVIVGNLCAVILNRIYAGRIHGGLKSFPFFYSRKRMKELFGYGVPAFITNASVKIIGQSDLVIIGILISVSSVREYSVGATLVYYSTSFIVLVSSTYFPSVQKMAASFKEDLLKDLFYDQLKLSLFVGILLYFGFFLYSKDFMRLWMYQDSFDLNSVYLSSTIMSVLAISKLPTVYIYPCKSILAAKGNIKFTAIVDIFEAIVNVIVSVCLVVFLDFGIVGVALGTLLSKLFIPSFIYPYFTCSVMKIKKIDFFKKVFIPAIFLGVMFYLANLFIFKVLPIYNWLSFFESVTLSVVFWIILSFHFLLPKKYQEKLFLKSK